MATSRTDVDSNSRRVLTPAALALTALATGIGTYQWLRHPDKSPREDHVLELSRSEDEEPRTARTSLLETRSTESLEHPDEALAELQHSTDDLSLGAGRARYERTPVGLFEMSSPSELQRMVNDDELNPDRLSFDENALDGLRNDRPLLLAVEHARDVDHQLSLMRVGFTNQAVPTQQRLSCPFLLRDQNGSPEFETRGAAKEAIAERIKTHGLEAGTYLHSISTSYGLDGSPSYLVQFFTKTEYPTLFTQLEARNHAIEAARAAAIEAIKRYGN